MTEGILGNHLGIKCLGLSIFGGVGREKAAEDDWECMTDEPELLPTQSADSPIPSMLCLVDISRDSSGARAEIWYSIDHRALA